MININYDDSSKLNSVCSLQVQVDGDAILDAEFLDVYKGTNGVIMMLDITKPW